MIDSLTEPLPADQTARTRVLVAEDDAASRRLLRLALEAMGFAVVTASDGVEVEEMVEEDPPSIILLDFEMPRRNGAAVCAWLREHPRVELRDIPIIMLTAHSGEAEEVACLKAGANDFITKPITRASLAARLETQMRLRALNESLRVQNEELANWRAAHIADLEAAQRVQLAVLPAHRALPGWNLAVEYEPAIEVGGDIYGIIPTHEGGVVWLADATGHGVAAALYTTLLSILFDRAVTETDPSRVLARVNAGLHKIFQGKSMLSAVCLRLLPDGEIHISGAGHPPLLVRRADGRVESIASQMTLLGIGESLEGPIATVKLAAGDRALLFTDGLYGARAADGSRQQVDDVAAAFSVETNAMKLAERMQANGHTDDDLTVITIHRDEEP